MQKPETTARKSQTRKRASPPILEASRQPPALHDGSTGQETRTADIWVKCQGCKEIAFRKRVERNLNVCPKCGYHLRLTVEQRLTITVDPGSWRELFADLVIGDPLEFVDVRPYRERLQAARQTIGRNDAALAGIGKIEGRPAAIAVMDFNFMGGSMGVVVGEKLAQLIHHGLAQRLPLIAFSSSGGARMQEGTLSLMQMAKVAAALTRLRDARIPYISVLCDPTTGGVAASFASLGDLNLAEPGAVIGFAGRRVIEQTTNQQLPEGFQTAEFLLRHGMLDAIVPRHRMRATLAQLLAMLTPRRPPRRSRHS
ncbi:MAG: acetyl-CoA carboxylase carboxyltransferase subunit beta [Deltaproteobacteria bacterium]|nr:acetyl-CoA carboxylase carboxyltransferase subunit beta [Deltaproteobacteria bacterium]